MRLQLHLRPRPVVGVVVGVHSEQCAFDVESRGLILPAQEKVALRADERERAMQAAASGDVEHRQRRGSATGVIVRSRDRAINA